MNQVVVKKPELAMPVGTAEAEPLNELMLAMDVVDTLRHRELMLEREVEAGDRDQRLLLRLREIYTGQGIAVTDDVLAQGVSALREERFLYVAPGAELRPVARDALCEPRALGQVGWRCGGARRASRLSRSSCWSFGRRRGRRRRSRVSFRARTR